MGDSNTKTHWNVSQANVFISYSRQNRNFAKDLYRRLDAESFKLWRDVHDIEAGADDWWEAIKQGIEQCDTLILCMSMPALKSPVVSDEWFYARQLGKRVIPVVADDIWNHPEVLSGEFTIPNWMNRRNWIDYREGQPEADIAWQNLIDTLKRPYEPKRFINMVGELPPRFVRRPHDIDRAIRSLVDDHNDAVAMTTALRGAGGYGKTTLAKAIARDVRIQGVFDDGILWVTLGEELLKKQGDTLRSVLIGMIQELIHALTGERTVIETLDMANTKLKEAIGDLYILLVIDDVWDETHLKPFLVNGSHGACLITTRNADTVAQTDIIKHEIDKMLPVEAVELLSAGFAPEDVAPLEAEFTAFARDLREYPLLLALANTTIANWKDDLKISLSEALQLACETFVEQGILGFDDQDTQDRTHAVDLTLSVSLNQLQPEEKRRYLELAIFRADALIPLTTLERYWGMSKVQTLQFCTRLYRRTALLHSFEGMAVRIHDVFRDYLIRQHTSEVYHTLHTRLIDRYDNLTALPDDYAWHHLAYHLIEAGQSETLRNLLLDFNFLEAKLTMTDAAALWRDCDTFLTYTKDDSIHALYSALSTSAHILYEDPRALGHQLVGRLMGHRRKNAEIRALTESIPLLQPGLYPIDFDTKFVTHDQAGGLLLRTLAGHTNKVNGAVALADGRFLSWSADATLRLWANDGTPLTVLEGHTRGINGALALADGHFVSCSGDATLRLWANDGTPLKIFEGYNTTKNTRIGELRIEALANNRFLSWTGGLYSHDYSLRLWATDGSSSDLLETKGIHYSVYGVTSLDGGRFLSWGGGFLAPQYNPVQLWDENGLPLVRFVGHTESVTGVQALADGRFLSWSEDNTWRLWANDGSPLKVFEGHTSSVSSVIALADGRFLSWSTDQTLRLWASEGASLDVSKGHKDWVVKILALNDGRFLSWSWDGTLRLWAKDGAPLAVLEGHTDAVAGVLVLADGRFLSWTVTSSSSAYNRIRLWSKNGSLLTVLEHTGAVHGVLALNNGRLLSWSADHTLRLWTNDGVPITALVGHDYSVTGAVALNDGRLLSWSADHTLRLWTNDGVPITALVGHTDRVEGCKVLEDGRFLSWSWDNTLRLWASDGSPLAVMNGHTGKVEKALVLYDGRFLSWGMDMTLRLWTSDGVSQAVLTGHSLVTVNGWIKGIIDAVMLSDGRILSWGHDATLRLWTQNGSPLDMLNEPCWGDRKRIYAWADKHSFDPNVLFADEPIISGYKAQKLGNRLILYNPHDGNAIKCFWGDAMFTDVVVSKDERVMVVGDRVGRVLFLRWTE